MPSADPRWSIIVPTRSRPEQLARCVRACAGLRSPEGGFELIVVDDDSTPGEPELPNVRPKLTRIVSGGGRGPAAARNIGAAAAAGTRIAFTDDDCAPLESWLTALDRALDRGDRRATCGFTRNVSPDLASEAGQIVVDALRRAERTPGGDPAFAPSSNLAFRRDEFEAIGGFDESFPGAAGEDRELCERWVAAGNQLVEVNGAVVAHEHRLDVAGLWRHHRGYGAGARRFHGSGSGRSTLGRLRLQARFYRALGSEVVARTRDGSRPRPSLAAMVALTQLANAVGYASGGCGPESS